MLLAMSSAMPILIAAVVVIICVVGFVLYQRRSQHNQELVGKKSTDSVVTSAPMTDHGLVPMPEVYAPSTSEELETPKQVVESPATRMTRLRDRLSLSQSALGQSLRSLIGSTHVSEDDWQDLEDSLIMADVGVRASGLVIAELKTALKRSGDNESLESVAKKVLTDIVDGGFNRELATSRHDDHPAIVLTVGVNGTGKTTTTGKLARLLSVQDKDVLLGAADTFRAAAAEQLGTWGERVGVPVVRGPEGSDPASVAFDAVAAGIDQEVDVVLIDTAGRLHTKQGLMDELGKVYRVASKSAPIDEVLLVIDATTGQNGLTQAKVFAEVVPVTGVVLTKLDGTAKGGIIIAVQNELGVPVKLVGLGEGPDDLAPFDPHAFVSGLFL